MSDEVEIVEQKEVSFRFDTFLLVYNQDDDYWYIEFEEEDEDDFLDLGNIESLIGKTIKGHSFFEEDVKKFKKIIELEDSHGV